MNKIEDYCSKVASQSSRKSYILSQLMLFSQTRINEISNEKTIITCCRCQWHRNILVRLDHEVRRIRKNESLKIVRIKIVGERSASKIVRNAKVRGRHRRATNCWKEDCTSACNSSTLGFTYRGLVHIRWPKG